MKREKFSRIVFGLGVLGMGFSTIIILMLINGFTVCEMAGKPMTGTWHRIGCYLPGVTGALGALFLWKQAAFYLAVPLGRRQAPELQVIIANAALMGRWQLAPAVEALFCLPALTRRHAG